MANLKDLLQDLYTKAAAYDALNTLVGTNGQNIATNVAHLETIDGDLATLSNKLNSIRDVKAFNLETAYTAGDLVEDAGVIYKCIADSTGNALDNSTYFVSAGGSVDLSPLETDLAAVKAVTDQIQFEDLELDGVTYSLVTKKPAQEETQEPADPETPSEQTEPSGE